MRIAVLVKQVPAFAELTLGEDGRLLREGLDLEMNPYCRRAVSKGVELAASSGGTCTVFTLGPPAAEDVLREAVAWGADEGVLITDRAFAGSDTLATARALAGAMRHEGPFDLILVGRNSVDADTGQVGPEMAELLDLAFAGAVRELTIEGTEVHARLEEDDGWSTVALQLPAVLATAERLCDPCKVDPEGRARVHADKIRRLTAADLGEGPWGQAGSPTWVGATRLHEVHRLRQRMEGTAEEQVQAAVALLRERGALDASDEGGPTGAVPPSPGLVGKPVVVVVEPDRAHLTKELLGSAALLAAEISGHVVAIGPALGATAELGAAGADAIVTLDTTGTQPPEDIAAATTGWARTTQPWAIIVPSTGWGREVAARVAAALESGLTGDAVAMETDGEKLVAWKPAFGGQLVAAITALSPVQLVTVRAGMLPRLVDRPGFVPPVTVVAAPARGRVKVLDHGRDDDLDALAEAHVVVGVGSGVKPEDYPLLDPLLEALGAELAATRKVTDKGWLPRARQVGITGRSIAPRLYIAIGLSGKFNHMVGVRASDTIVAMNNHADALVYDVADIGLVGDWKELVPLLVEQLQAAPLVG